ncbi:MAG: hypothetical protein AAF533_23360 [Acidobacteriota bacterium]
MKDLFIPFSIQPNALSAYEQELGTLPVSKRRSSIRKLERDLARNGFLVRDGADLLREEWERLSILKEHAVGLGDALTGIEDSPMPHCKSLNSNDAFADPVSFTESTLSRESRQFPLSRWTESPLLQESRESIEWHDGEKKEGIASLFDLLWRISGSTSCVIDSYTLGLGYDHERQGKATRDLIRQAARHSTLKKLSFIVKPQGEPEDCLERIKEFLTAAASSDRPSPVTLGNLSLEIVITRTRIHGRYLQGPRATIRLDHGIGMLNDRRCAWGSHLCKLDPYDWSTFNNKVEQIMKDAEIWSVVALAPDTLTLRRRQRAKSSP